MREKKIYKYQSKTTLKRYTQNIRALNENHYNDSINYLETYQQQYQNNKTTQR